MDLDFEFTVARLAKIANNNIFCWFVEARAWQGVSNL
jgi:hypothetical protein